MVSRSYGGNGHSQKMDISRWSLALFFAARPPERAPRDGIHTPQVVFRTAGLTLAASTAVPRAEKVRAPHSELPL